MATQTKVSSLNQMFQKQIIKPRFIWTLAAIATLIVILVIGFAFIPTLSTVENETGSQRALDASAARYTAMAEFYLANDEANRQRAIKAESARYSGLAEFHLGENKSSVQRALDASAARYTAMAEYYIAAGK